MLIQHELLLRFNKVLLDNIQFYHPEPPKLPPSASFTSSTKPLPSIGKILPHNVMEALPQSLARESESFTALAPCDVFDLELAEFVAAGKPSPTFNLDVEEESLSQWGDPIMVL